MHLFIPSRINIRGLCGKGEEIIDFDIVSPSFTKVGMSCNRLTGYFTHQCLGSAYASPCVGSTDPREGFSTKTEESPYLAAIWGQSVTDFTRKSDKSPVSVHFVSQLPQYTIHLFTKRSEMSESCIDAPFYTI